MPAYVRVLELRTLFHFLAVQNKKNLGFEVCVLGGQVPKFAAMPDMHSI